MEEKKKAQSEKLSYEELSKAASDLHVQYQKLIAEYQKLMQAYQERNFEYSSFILNSLFRVMDHPEMYSDEFIKYVVENIEWGIRTSLESLEKAAEEESKDKKGETE